MHEKRFDGSPDKLRSENRLAILEVNRVIDLSLEGIEAASMLDVGTGSGLFAERFQTHGLQVAGVDVSQEMLDVASQHVPSASLRLGTAEKLPFGDDFCDLVFMGLVLHETDAPLQALKEARRVGRLRTAVLEWYYAADQAFGPPLEHRLSGERIRELSEQAGFGKFSKHALSNLVLYLLDVGLD
ncbi:MAG: class I SAM-dependent methyltransferase [Anaerolineaceae bacterium]|jgi:SAM-dependent methyltransferase|nr:class I SAM-dependent methyltransferase [Anaerolineaceae bacterium]